jgi:hypothetical protein
MTDCIELAGETPALPGAVVLTNTIRSKMFLNESVPGGIVLPAGLLQSRTNRPGKHENHCHPVAVALLAASPLCAADANPPERIYRSKGN